MPLLGHFPNGLFSKNNLMRYTFLLVWMLFFVQKGQAAPVSESDTAYDLERCIAYAFQHSPRLQLSLIDEKIADHAIKSRLSEWYPQIRSDYNVQHAFQLQMSNINGQLIPLGQKNNSSLQLGVTQNIFSSEALLASSTAREVRKQAQQQVISDKIDLWANVGKAYYDVLLTNEQIRVLDEDITRLDRSLADALSQYEAGIVDKVDYKRATIALNNAQAQRKTADEVRKAKLSYLKLQMGYPDSLRLELANDTLSVTQISLADTSAGTAFRDRIEFQQLETLKKLQQANYRYYKWQFLPNVQAFGNYNLNYLSGDIDKLYNDNYPNSFVGVRVGLPLFQGFKRTHQIKVAQLQIEGLEQEQVQLQNSVRTEIQQALASYKGYRNDYEALRENLSIAKEVFETIELQYRSGIKTYLEVITAQTDLRTASLNYANSLYRLLASKIDLQKALGAIRPY